MVVSTQNNWCKNIAITIRNKNENQNGISTTFVNRYARIIVASKSTIAILNILKEWIPLPGSPKIFLKTTK